MPTFPNLPTIGASQVTNAGATSNDADAAVIDGLANPRAETVDNTNAFTITNAASDYLWERNISWRFTEDASAPTAQITLTVPTTPARGLFGIINATGQDMQVETSAQVLTAPVIAAGDAALLSNDGTNVELLSSAAGVATFLGLTDTPSSLTAGKFLKVNAGGTALIETDEPAGAGDALPFTLSPAWRGCILELSVDLTGINATAGYLIPWDQEGDDTDVFHDTVTNNTRITIPAGVTRIKIDCAIETGAATADEWNYLQVIKNGVIADRISQQANEIGFVANLISVSTGDFPVAEGDYFEIRFVQQTDTSITINSDRTKCRMTVVETTDTVPSLRTVVASLPSKWRGARLSKSAAQTSIGTGVVEATWDTVKRDTAGLADTANNGFTIPAGVSKARLTANISIDNAGTDGGLLMRVYRDGAAITNADSLMRMHRSEVAADSHAFVHTPVMDVVEGETYTLVVQVDTDATADVTTSSWFEIEIVEFNSSTDAVQAYIAVPPEHKGALLKRTATQSIPDNVQTPVEWQAATYDTSFDPGDGGPAQRFWLGVNTSFVDGDVSVANDEITVTAHGYQTGEGPVRLTSSGTLPAGLALATDYWFIRVDANTYKFATSRANALAGTDVDITAAAGGGSHTVEHEAKLIVPAGVSKVEVSGNVFWAAGTTSTQQIVFYNKNGAAVDGTSLVTSKYDTSSYQGSNGPVIEVSEGDVFELIALQGSTGARNIINDIATWVAIKVVEESRAITYPGVTVTPPWMGAHVRPSADLTAFDANPTATVTLDAVDIDTDNIFNDANDSVIVPAGVTKVIINASIRMILLNLSTDAAIIISKNGSDEWTEGGRFRVHPSTADVFQGFTTSGVINVSEGDEFRLRAFASGDDSITISVNGTWLEMVIVETDENAFPPESVEFFINGIPGTSDMIYQKVATRRFTLSDDFAGSEAYFETAPSGGALVFDVDRNGVKIGEIQFADGVKAATFVTTAAAVEVFDVGDRLGIDSPANLFSAADMSIALWAWRS